MKTLSLFFLFISILFLSQNKGKEPANTGSKLAYSLIKNFSEKEGLSSNQVYDMVQGSHGFLWIATDNGVSRFDGKRFYTYSVSDGLPSNDVIQIFRDKTGRIWANSDMKPLAYFDEKNNRFVKYQDKAEYFKELRVYIYNNINGIYYSRTKSGLVEIGDQIIIAPNKNVTSVPAKSLYG